MSDLSQEDSLEVEYYNSEEDVEDNLDPSRSDEETDYSDEAEGQNSDDELAEYTLDEEDELLLLRSSNIRLKTPSRARVAPASPKPAKTKQVATRVARVKTNATHEYASDFEHASHILRTLEDTLEESYPDAKDNAVIARCAYYYILYKSYYPIEVQEKISSLIEQFRD